MYKQDASNECIISELLLPKRTIIFQTFWIQLNPQNDTTPSNDNYTSISSKLTSEFAFVC